MKVFNARHFLRHISMPTLKQFTKGHVLGARLNVDWGLSPTSLPAAVGDAVQDLETRTPEFDATERSAVEHDLRLWVDDLRRAHLMSNGLALAEFRSICQLDAEGGTCRIPQASGISSRLRLQKKVRTPAKRHEDQGIEV